MSRTIQILRRNRGRVVTAALALVVVTAGAATAAVAYNSLTGAHVRNESLSGLDIKNGTIFSADVRDGGLLGLDLKADTLTGREVNERTLGVPANISQTLDAVDVANAAAGDATAETTLLSRGDLSLTASCWRQDDTGALHLDLQLKSVVNGAMLTSSLDNKAGGAAAAGVLNIDTPKVDRQVLSPNTATNTFRLGTAGEFTAWAPGGDYMRGTVNSVLQDGVVSGVTGPLGTGNRCHVVGYVSAVAV
jgi:hypothetical protein